MRIFSSELAHNYQTYTFGYTNYGELEPGDTLADVYNAGFLPYSGTPQPGLFYMARSARVILEQCVMTSENRRIAKKFDGQFTKQRIPAKDFKIDEVFLKFCLDYFEQKHGASVMPRERLEFIFNCGLITSFIIYHKDNKPVAAVCEVGEGNMGHYWFSFYDLSLAEQSLGLWLMLDSVRDAKERGLTHYYVGTVYGAKALYKTNFEPLEWWTGEEWARNVALLKERGRNDNLRTITQTDMWKEGKKLF